MFKLALKNYDACAFAPTVSVEAQQLRSNTTLQDAEKCITDRIDTKSVINITGLPGSGRTTYTQALIKRLIQSGFIKESEVMYMKIGCADSVESLLNFAIEIAKNRSDHNTVTLLASSVSNEEEKTSAIVNLLNNFKIICFDELRGEEKDSKSLGLKISSLVQQLQTTIICVTSQFMIENADKCIEIHGLSQEITRGVINVDKMTASTMESSYEHLLLNARAIQLYIKSCHEFGLFEVTRLENHETPVQKVLEMIWQRLNNAEKTTMLRLVELRRPLPLKHPKQLLARLIKIGLVKFETASLPDKCGLVSVSDSVQKCLQHFSRQEVPDVKQNCCLKEFDVFDLWTSLLLVELQSLVADARQNAWPFVPEKWQYASNAGEEESYNVKDLLTQKNKDFPHLTQCDILQECLHHSTTSKDYQTMAAIVFVLDRFVYWQGSSKALLSIVDSIKKGDPSLPIAPQLVIRKARILRTSGDLQGAEKLLDRLLDEQEMLGTWHYKEQHDYTLVKAVSIQIKGEIQSSLGQWLTAAIHLLDSMTLFKRLPKVDKKGLSCSLGLLVNVLQNISTEDYQNIVKTYSLGSPSPYLQAHTFAQEAADFAIFTPLFFARHKRRAGEMLLEYSLTQSAHDRSEYLENAWNELKQSVKAHEAITSLNSREQYYEFISALYKTSCVYELRNDKNTADELKKISKLLYEHYCQYPISVVHGTYSQQLVNNGLTMLGLPPLAQVLHEAVFGGGHLIDNTKTHSETERFQGFGEKSDNVVDRYATTLQSLSKMTTVDRFKTTVATRNISDVNNDDSEIPRNDECLVNDAGSSVHECESSRYDAVNVVWRTQKTLVYIGEQLNLQKGKKGAQRDPFMVECLNQDEPLGKYVGKRYKEVKEPEQYKQDVHCQMTARYFVGLFNQDLYKKGIEVSHIQFLPVVMVCLLDSNGDKTSQVYNIEPYIHGDFIKLTNNWRFVEKEGEGSKLVLAFSHYTYDKSNKTMVIVDHQGWTSSDHLSTTFLTDPQIHSITDEAFGTGNLGQEGIDTFWTDMHTECNEICQQLGLRRP